MALFRRSKRKGGGLSPITAGAITAAIIALFVVVIFGKINPLHRPYEFKATFASANALKPNSPVRIAGVEVGKVTKVDPVPEGNGAALVTMEIEDVGLPIHVDAQMKIRPRIFLEGNFFVDVQPGTPGTPELEDGGTIPVNQTDTPVQFGQVLAALQSDTREDLKTFLREYGQNALGNGDRDGAKTGADFYNEMLDDAPAALRNVSIANDATLGRRPGDLYRVIRSQQRVARALSRNPETLQDLITNFNVTARALSADQSALQRTVPALRDLVVRGRPALAQLDAALPTVRAFARDALPGTRSSVQTLRESRPFISQLRQLVSERELKGLTRDLRPTIPALARLNRSTIPLLGETRALSACQNEVLLPFANTQIPDPDFPDNRGSFAEQAPRGLVGLSGESRLFDANSPLFHIAFGTGPTTIFLGDRGEDFFAQAPEAPAGVRPIRPNERPRFRPDVPCETQQAPDLNAPGGPASRSITATGDLVGQLPGIVCNVIAGQIIPCPGTPLAKTFRQDQREVQEVEDFFRRSKAGKPVANPFNKTRRQFLRELDKMGLESTKEGRIRPKQDAAPAPKTQAGLTSNSEDTAP